MNFERLKSKKSEEKVLDAEWFPRLSSCFFEDYEMLTGTKEVRNEQKNYFFSGDIANPVLDYPKIDIENLSNRESVLMSLKNDVLENEKNETVKKIYRTKINEMVAAVRMLKGTAEGDDRKFDQSNKRHICALVDMGFSDDLLALLER